MTGVSGITPDNFSSFAGLAVTDDYLFVADSLIPQVQIMLVNPSAPDLGI
jgi:hypothetical protein